MAPGDVRRPARWYDLAHRSAVPPSSDDDDQVTDAKDPIHEIAVARLAAIVDCSDDAIVSKTLDGVITSWNAAAERLFGYTAAEAIGRNITLIIPHDRLDEERQVLASVRRGDRVDHFETIRRAKDGHFVEVSLTVSPVRDASGRIVGASKIARDIGARRAVEQSLATTIRRLEILYRLADAVGKAKSVEGVCEASIDAILAAGADRASVLSFDDAGVMHFRAWRNLSEGYRAVVEGHSPWSPDTREPQAITMPDVTVASELGDLRDVVLAEGVRALAFIPLVSHDRLLGKFMLYYDRVHVFTDDELQLAESIAQHVAFGLDRILAETSIASLLAAEKAARAEADAANRGKDQFLAVVSHELRTPLNAVLGWARMLRGNQLGERERARALEVIERNALLQSQLIGDLLDLSRIAVGKMEIERTPVNLAVVARQAAEGVAAEIKAKKLDFVVELDPAAGEVLGEALRLQQVVSNLLSNAIKFTPEGGRVELRLFRHEASTRLTVADTGIGVEPALLSQIFDPFEQADASTTRKHRGLGLGLAIARQLVALHEGRISAESDGLGKGARFIVDLPVLAVRDDARVVVPDARPASGRPGISLQQCRFLIVDDQTDARDLLAFVLSRSGAEVLTAGSGTEALQVLDLRDVDVLVSDIAMPELDGFALIEQIRGSGRVDASFRAIALTAHLDPRVRARALAAGFDACVTKPVDAESLIELLGLLRNRR